MNVRGSYYPLVLTLLVLDSLAVILRFRIRCNKSAIGYDDWALAVAFVGFVVFGAMELAAISYGIGATTVEPGFDMIKAAMYFTIAQIVYILATGVSKLAIGLVLLRLVSGSDMFTLRGLLIASMTITSLWTSVCALIFALQCRPLSVAWGVGDGTCMSTTILGNAGLALSAMDVSTSWFYALLPIWLLHKAQLSIKLKISILVLLGLGAVSSIATIIRLKFVVEIIHMSTDTGLASSNIIQKTLEATLYSILEVGISIFAAALTALGPLLRTLPCFTGMSNAGESSSSPLRSLRTFGELARKQPAHRLEDLNHVLADSQENIVSRKTAVIRKQADIMVFSEDSPAKPPQQRRDDW